MESAGPEGGRCFQHQCLQRMVEQDKGKKDGLLHGLIRRALGLPGGFSGWWGHTRWVTISKIWLKQSNGLSITIWVWWWMNRGKATSTDLCFYCLVFLSLLVPSVLWHCWLGGRKGIRPVKNWVVGCWRGYLSGARCRLAHSPADATATHCLLLQ